MDEPDLAEMRARLEDLKIEHRDLDGVIASLQTQDPGDQLQVSRLKRRKLMLKDEIIKLEDTLLPDIIA
jgi:hypothetical protein